MFPLFFVDLLNILMNSALHVSVFFKANIFSIAYFFKEFFHATFIFIFQLKTIVLQVFLLKFFILKLFEIFY
jgi:hypothetical protein